MTLMALADEQPLLRSQLVGYMVFPHDEAMREKLALTTILKAKSLLGGDITVTAAEARLLSEGPGLPAIWRMIQRAGQQGGISAGETLISLLRQVASNIQPSIGKAHHLLRSDFPMIQLKNGKRARMARSISGLRDAWAEYQYVSHFWAALRITLRPELKEFSLTENPYKFSGFAMLLYEMTAPLRQHPHAILSTDGWLFPSKFPALTSMTMPGLDDEALLALKNYRPRARD